MRKVRFDELFTVTPEGFRTRRAILLGGRPVGEGVVFASTSSMAALLHAARQVGILKVERTESELPEFLGVEPYGKSEP